MQLKASLHIHTSEDKRDGHMIDYSIYQLIDEAKKKGFRVLGFTPHQKFVFKPEFAAYAAQQGILLIPGVERNLGRFLFKHVIVLNCDRSIEKVNNLKQLRRYKAEHPEIFILAPHPTFSRLVSLGARQLKNNIDLFDAIEYSWFYSPAMNNNRRAKMIADEFGKPMIATSDVHVLKRLNSDYAFIDAEEFTAESVLKAIAGNRFENITAPKQFGDLMKYVAVTLGKYIKGFTKIYIFGFEKITFSPKKN
jgi:hypothetical protein